MKKIFGLDFGTSNSALSVNIDGEVSMLDIDKFNTTGNTLKSVIYFDPEEKKFYEGQQAVDQYIENDARGRYIQSIKAFLSDPNFKHTEIGKKTYKLDQLVAIILRNIKERGQEQIGQELSSVVLGRPVVFSEDPDREKLAVERLMSAAKIAGFDEIYFQYEPIAAALAFESTLALNEERIVFVGDFGGGTSDFTIIKTQGGKYKQKVDRKNDILGLGGVYIGGDTFDSQLMWEKVAYHFGKNVRVKALMGNFDLPVSSTVMEKLRKWHLIPQLKLPKTRQLIRDIRYQADNPELIKNLEALVDENYGYMLFQSIERSKIKLSETISSTINFNELSVNIEERVSRSEFETFIASDMQKIEACIEEVTKQSKMRCADIDVVFLTGGSSYIPIIKRIFSDKFGAEKINQANAFTSVAYGLGISGNSYI